MQFSEFLGWKSKPLVQTFEFDAQTPCAAIWPPSGISWHRFEMQLWSAARVCGRCSAWGAQLVHEKFLERFLGSCTGGALVLVLRCVEVSWCAEAAPALYRVQLCQVTRCHALPSAL